MDGGPDELLATVEPPPNATVARKVRVGWRFADFVETSGRAASFRRA